MGALGITHAHAFAQIRRKKSEKGPSLNRRTLAPLSLGPASVSRKSRSMILRSGSVTSLLSVGKLASELLLTVNPPPQIQHPARSEKSGMLLFAAMVMHVNNWIFLM